jgi:2-oxoglutarate ferredoxin oxidoreductase subunit delta
MATKKARKWRSKIDIKTEWCKGCAICVEFCPRHVLAMDVGKVVVHDLDACIMCGLCEIRCPDFCITVTKLPVEDETETEDDEE